MHKICFVLEGFFPTNRAGTEVYVLNLCQFLKRNGWDIHVLISTCSGQEDYAFEGIPVHTFSIPLKPDVKELNGLIPPHGIEGFIQRVNEINPDFVHFHSFGRAINGFHLEAVKKLGIKTVYTPHLGGIFCIKGNLMLFESTPCNAKVIESRCIACFVQSQGKPVTTSKIIGSSISFLTKIVKDRLPSPWYLACHRKAELLRLKLNADLIFSIAPWIQKAFDINGIQNTILIPQGISPLFLEKKEFEFKPIQNPIHFAFIGRMHPSKGFHLLSKAWDYLSKNEAILHVITNPSGEEFDYFEKYKEWAKKKKNVIWNEGFSQQEVLAYISEIDVLVLPSISNEVAPLVILEAASRSIPTIGSDYVAIQDMIEHNNNGLLFSNGNWKGLKLELERIINEDGLLNNLRLNIKTPYSMNQVSQLIEKAYLGLL